MAYGAMTKLKTWIFGFRSLGLKDGVSTVQGIATVIAIAAGGWWFLQQGLAKPRVKIDQTVTFRPLAGSDTEWLIAVDVRATNTGSVAVHLSSGDITIAQVNPVPGGKLLSDDLRELWLEPGESDQALFRTYKVPKQISTLQLTSEYRVPGKEFYWSLVSVADLKTDESGAFHAVSVPK